MAAGRQRAARPGAREASGACSGGCLLGALGMPGIETWWLHIYIYIYILLLHIIHTYVDIHTYICTYICMRACMHVYGWAYCIWRLCGYMHQGFEYRLHPAKPISRLLAPVCYCSGSCRRALAPLPKPLWCMCSSYGDCTDCNRLYRIHSGL